MHAIILVLKLIFWIAKAWECGSFWEEALRQSYDLWLRWREREREREKARERERGQIQLTAFVNMWGGGVGWQGESDENESLPFGKLDSCPSSLSGIIKGGHQISSCSERHLFSCAYSQKLCMFQSPFWLYHFKKMSNVSWWTSLKCL